MAQGPNPIEAYEATIKVLTSIVAGVTEAQLSSSTPCAEWTVQALINHNLGVQGFFNSILSKLPPVQRDVNGPLPQEGAEAAFKAVTDTTLATLKSLNLEEPVEAPFGTMPGGQLIMIGITDMIVHKWDLAKATGQDLTIDSSLAELGIQVLTPIMSGGRGDNFGPEIAVPAGASAQDRLLGLSGRTP
jgi:uncharacterized protein (TIGR03086 family)